MEVENKIKYILSKAEYMVVRQAKRKGRRYFRKNESRKHSNN